MISKEEWREALGDRLSEERTQQAPPAVEEVEDLFSGKLTGEDAERVRYQLSHHPEMIRVMTTAVPADADEALTDAEVAAGMAKVRQRVDAGPPPPHRRRQRVQTLAIAASLVLIVGLAGVAYRRWQREPRVLVTKILYADGERGTTRGSSLQPPIELNTETDYRLEPVFRPPRAYREYRLELYELVTSPSRVIWSRDGVERQLDGSYEVELSTRGLQPGRYKLVLYGIDDEPSQLATYSLRLYEP
jgi:hypothetical protein